MVIVDTSVRGKPLKTQFMLDGFHKKILDEGKDLIDKNFDFVNVVVGKEGAGKTTFVLLSAYYQDPNITLDNVVFDAEAFSELVDNVADESVIIWDEADELTNHWADKIVTTIKRKFKRIRKKKLSIWLVTPTVFDLNWYFIDHRTNAIWEIYHEGLERGYWRVYTKESKNYMIHNGKRLKYINPKYKTKFGRFVNLPKKFPIDIEEYDIKKEEATKEIKVDKNDKKIGVVDIRRYIFKNFVTYCEKNGLKFTQKQIGEMFGYDSAIISRDMSALGLKPMMGNNTGWVKKKRELLNERRNLSDVE